MFLSVFDMFKIGIGPSSSHTMGPMSAAARFLDEILTGDWPRPADARIHRLTASLHGSLAYTGVGHGTNRAVVLGLAGQLPETIDPDEASDLYIRVIRDKTVQPDGHPEYRFDPANDLVLDRQTALSGHANGMAFSAFDADGKMLLRRIYYSIGGGFVVTEEELSAIRSEPLQEKKPVPHPFSNAAQMLRMAAESGKSIAELLDISVNSVGAALSRARAKLAKALDTRSRTGAAGPPRLQVSPSVRHEPGSEWRRRESDSCRRDIAIPSGGGPIG